MADIALCSCDGGDGGRGDGGDGGGGGGLREMSRSQSDSVILHLQSLPAQLCSQLQLLYIAGLHVQHPISQPHTTHTRATVIIIDIFLCRVNYYCPPVFKINQIL